MGSEAAAAAATGFQARLAELGYAEERSLVIEKRFFSAEDANAQQAEADQMARELASIPVDVIIVTGSPARVAAERATSSLPIVLMGGGPDQEDMASLARPAGNVTGVLVPAGGLALKRLQLLAQAVPAMTRVLTLGQFPEVTEAEWQTAIESLGLARARPGPTVNRDGLENQIARAAADGVDGLVVGSGRASLAWADLTIELAERYRLPASYPRRTLVEQGGLMAYSPRLIEVQRTAADYVDRLLRGARPTDLPMQMQTNYDLVVNLKAARAIGLTLPQSFMALADEVIE